MAVYHKEQLVTSEEAEMVASTTDEASWMWVEIAFSKDVDTAARIADILDEYGFNDDAAHIRGNCVSLVCVYKFCTGF